MNWQTKLAGIANQAKKRFLDLVGHDFHAPGLDDAALSVMKEFGVPEDDMLRYVAGNRLRPSLKEVREPLRARGLGPVAVEALAGPELYEKTKHLHNEPALTQEALELGDRLKVHQQQKARGAQTMVRSRPMPLPEPRPDVPDASWKMPGWVPYAAGGTALAGLGYGLMRARPKNDSVGDYVDEAWMKGASAMGESIFNKFAGIPRTFKAPARQAAQHIGNGHVVGMAADNLVGSMQAAGYNIPGRMHDDITRNIAGQHVGKQMAQHRAAGTLNGEVLENLQGRISMNQNHGQRGPRGQAHLPVQQPHIDDRLAAFKARKQQALAAPASDTTFPPSHPQHLSNPSNAQLAAQPSVRPSAPPAAMPSLTPPADFGSAPNLEMPYFPPPPATPSDFGTMLPRPSLLAEAPVTVPSPPPAASRIPAWAQNPYAQLGMAGAAGLGLGYGLAPSQERTASVRNKHASVFSIFSGLEKRAFNTRHITLPGHLKSMAAGGAAGGLIGGIAADDENTGRGMLMGGLLGAGGAGLAKSHINKGVLKGLDQSQEALNAAHYANQMPLMEQLKPLQQAYDDAVKAKETYRQGIPGMVSKIDTSNPNGAVDALRALNLDTTKELDRLTNAAVDANTSMDPIKGQLKAQTREHLNAQLQGLQGAKKRMDRIF